MKTLCMNLIHFDFLIVSVVGWGWGSSSDVQTPEHRFSSSHLIPRKMKSEICKFMSGYTGVFYNFIEKRWAIIANHNVKIVVILEVVCKRALCYFKV